LRRVDEMGGTIKALEDGWFQRQMADSAYDLELKKADGDYVLIGVNKYVEEDDKVDIETHPFDEETGRRQLERLRRAKAQRDGAEVARLFGKLTEIARDDRQNIVPITVELVKARATLGEICDVLRAIWGTYREIPVI
jgi:methylmalonyl-CoA mutase N-terminal domain/subunit